MPDMQLDENSERPAPAARAGEQEGAWQAGSTSALGQSGLWWVISRKSMQPRQFDVRNPTEIRAPGPYCCEVRIEQL